LSIGSCQPLTNQSQVNQCKNTEVLYMQNKHTKNIKNKNLWTNGILVVAIKFQFYLLKRFALLVIHMI
jgi:hypothetical protein